jgi:hypothetical protein
MSRPVIQERLSQYQVIEIRHKEPALESGTSSPTMTVFHGSHQMGSTHDHWDEPVCDLVLQP